jgi:tungstate transport system ATP-binding protein
MYAAPPRTSQTVNRMQPILKAQDMSYRVDGAAILEGVNLEVNPGKIYTIVGPNGAGKSTLIRLLCLLERPTGGTVFMLGKNTTENWPGILDLRRKLSLVAQSPTMFSFSVYENVAAGLKFRGVPGSEIRQRVHDVLSFISIVHLLKRYAPSLSRGEAQMVALARAVVLEPSVLLLDEPTSSLDPQNTRALEEHLITLNRERGTTVVTVTHSLKQAQRLAHEIIFLYEGKIVECGDVSTFFSNPEKDTTRQFLEGEL